ncbi:MAG: hypothetical protein NC416_17170 [Eubacterium sp.]|nr:hypothetical protein [Eubacterium sp.]
MTVAERVFLCRLLEKMKGQEAYCESIGIRDGSRFRDEAVSQTNKEEKR